MKQISLDGRIGKDAEVLTTKGGKKYIRFSLANDTFLNGENKTEWFDITCYDPFIVDNRVKYLSKGRYVIVNGSFNTEVNVRNGKIYLNQYVTASTIDTPSFGTKREETEEVVSTYTGGTKSMPKAIQEEKPIEVQTTTSSKGWTASHGLNDMSDDDDLPF